MTKRVLFLFMYVVLLVFQNFGQVIVTDISNIKNTEGLNVIPDVNGKVLIAENMAGILKDAPMTGNIELYPNWPVQYNGSSQRGGVYCNLDADPELELVYCVSQQVYAWNMDGSVVAGWPVSVLLYPDGAPAFGDIDGDGEGEIVIATRQPGTGNTGRLHAFHKNGAPVEGFPVTLNGGCTKSTVLADLNGDNAMEIIVEERAYPSGYVAVYKGDGTAYPGFPVAMNEIPGSAPAVGDITGDNIPEIVAESYYNVFAYDINGNLLDGFPYNPGTGRTFSYSSPVLADLNGDGLREIIVGDHSTSSGNGAVHVIKSNGTAYPGWPQMVGYWIYGPPAVGDIDGDGNLDIAVGDQVLSGTPADKVYVWDKDGIALEGWPTSPINAINNQILLADLDGDDQVELMWDDNTGAGIYLGYNHDGTPMANWPLTVTGSTFFMNPFVTDINNDGVLDLSGASTDLSTNDLNFYLWNVNVDVNPEHSPLTILQYNVRHDGVYTDASVLNAAFTASAIDICEGDVVQFTDQSSGNVTSWNWTFEGGNPATSTDQNPLVTYDNTGSYDVNLTVSDGAINSTVENTDFIHVAYEAEIPATPDGPVNVVTAQTPYTFYETSCPNADEYIWELNPDSLGVILAGDTITQIKIYWSQVSNYSVTLKVKSVNACGESAFSDSLTIHINSDVGISQKVSSKPLTIWPIPAEDHITVAFTSLPVVSSVTLINNQGKIIGEISPDHGAGSVEFDTQSFSPGIYFLQLTTVDGIYSEKVLVK